MNQNQRGILTEVGTNELEVVEFIVYDRPYAINVAKVREIIRPQEIMPLPDANPHVIGVFSNREDIIPLIDLGSLLDHSGKTSSYSDGKIVVSEFNNTKIGFFVHSVKRIHRISWSDLETPDHGSILENRTTLGFIRLGKESEEGERIAFLLDFERIVGELVHFEEEENEIDDDGKAEKRKGLVILVAEDSLFMQRQLVAKLESGGYCVIKTNDGQAAWEKIDSGKRVDAVISDIEMPRMDGHHLTKKIKEDSRFKNLPVVLFSSMINEDMLHKGKSLGADAQICKPQINQLIEIVDTLVLG